MQEKIVAKALSAQHLPSYEQTADIFIKSLPSTVSPLTKQTQCVRTTTEFEGAIKEPKDQTQLNMCRLNISCAKNSKVQISITMC